MVKGLPENCPSCGIKMFRRHCKFVDCVQTSKTEDVVHTEKEYSVAKGIAGTILFGEIGAVAGIDGKDKSWTSTEGQNLFEVAVQCEQCSAIYKFLSPKYISKDDIGTSYEEDERQSEAEWLRQKRQAEAAAQQRSTAASTASGSRKLSGCEEYKAHQKSDSKFVVPEGVTYIDEKAFYINLMLEITLPPSINFIGTQAFAGCGCLEEITIPDGVSEIEDYTFFKCFSLEKVSLPKNLKSIDKEAFSGCTSLEAVIIPDGVKSIGDKAFYGCEKLTEIVIPDSVKKIAANAFRGCTSLKKVTICGEDLDIGYAIFEDCEALETIQVPRRCYSSNGKVLGFSEEKIWRDVIWKKLTGIMTSIPKNVKLEEYVTKAEMQRREEKQRKLNALNSEKSSLENELANLKGLFKGGRKREIEARIAQINSELDSLK